MCQQTKIQLTKEPGACRLTVLITAYGYLDHRNYEKTVVIQNKMILTLPLSVILKTLNANQTEPPVKPQLHVIL